MYETPSEVEIHQNIFYQRETSNLAFIKESDCFSHISRFFLITWVIQKIFWLRRAVLMTESEQSLYDVFFHCLKYDEFQASPMIFKNLFRVD